jgi:hypothetical protein
MQFWKISEPDYNSDYDHTFINGSLEHPLSIPGVECDHCGQTWGASRILTFECPKGLMKNNKIKESWPISVEENEQFRKLIKDKIGIGDLKLEPGYSFQPSYLDVASKPTFDFLWCSLASVVVSERVKDFFLRTAAHDVAFVKVNKRKIGKKEPVLPAPIPKTGEPEDIINEGKLEKNKALVKDYYEMIPNFESKMPLNTKVVSICPKCGREEIDTKSRLFLMTDSLWNQQAIFFLSTTLFIIITEDIKKGLEKLGVTNVGFYDITKKD